MAEITLATAADYADAMITARRAKNWLFLLLLLVLLIQLGIFIAVYRNVIATGAAATTTQPATTPTSSDVSRDVLRYLIGLTDFLGMAFAIVLSMVLLLIAKVMLVGRLIGVARVTSAYVWSIVLAVLLFPWQAFLDPYVFKIPGVLYTWDELMGRGHFTANNSAETILHWSRFVVFPAVALIILLLIQVKSTRGIRSALGEGVVHANDRASDA